MSVCLESSNTVLTSQVSATAQSEPPPPPPPINTQSTIKTVSKVIVTNTQATVIQKGISCITTAPVLTVVNTTNVVKPLSVNVSTTGLHQQQQLSVPTTASFTVTTSAPSIAATGGGVLVKAAALQDCNSVVTAAGNNGQVSTTTSSSTNANTGTPTGIGIHNVFVKKSAAAAAVSQQQDVMQPAQQAQPQQQQLQDVVPQSHKILTANTFPTNNVITNLSTGPVLKTVNGQRPTITTNKVKILSNVVMTPATNNTVSIPQIPVPITSTTITPILAGPSNTNKPPPPSPQQRYYQQPTFSQQQSHKAQIVVGNGATKYLNKSQQPTPVMSQSQQQSSAVTAERKMVYHPQQYQYKTAPTAQSSSISGKNCQNSSYKSPGQVQRTNAGLRTIPPQRPTTATSQPKTNYIGKHAFQAQRIKQAKAKATKQHPVNNSYNHYHHQTQHHHPHPPQHHHSHHRGGTTSTTASAPIQPQQPPTQMTFNQALTAQILETLGNDTPYTKTTSVTNHQHHYDISGNPQANHHYLGQYHHSHPYQQQPPQLQQVTSTTGGGGSGKVIQAQSNLDTLSFVCQAVLLDHNYNATMPAEAPTVQQQQQQPPPQSPVVEQMQRQQAVMPVSSQQVVNTIASVAANATGVINNGALLTSGVVIGPRQRHNSARSEREQHDREQRERDVRLQGKRSSAAPAVEEDEDEDDDDAGSDISDGDAKRDTAGEETETAEEGDSSSTTIADTSGGSANVSGKLSTSGSGKLSTSGSMSTVTSAAAVTVQQQQQQQVVVPVAPVMVTTVGPPVPVTATESHGGYGDYVTRCICGFIHDDGYMIECDGCKVWQHVRCVIRNMKVPDDYMCEECDPGKSSDRQRARNLQQQWMRDIQERDAKEREKRARKESGGATGAAILPPLPGVTTAGVIASATPAIGFHQPMPSALMRQHQQQRNSTDTDSSDGDGPLTNASVIHSGAGAKRRAVGKETAASRRQTGTGHSRGGPRGKRKERKVPVKRTKKQQQLQQQQDALLSPTTLGGSSDGGGPGDKLPQLRQWIENYEEAVTNHYSPELRARVSNIRTNGDLSGSGCSASGGRIEFTTSNKCRVHCVLPGVKCLVATAHLPPETAVVELRGKYMLSTQHRTTNRQQRPGPFLFFHRLRDNTTEICVDTRTYGNCARFVRRSCTPNSELRHVIEKGALHVYLVTTTAVDRGGELTIRHETQELSSPTAATAASTASDGVLLPCACNSPQTCTVAVSSVVTVGAGGGRRRGGIAATAVVTDGEVVGTGRRRRGRYSRDSVKDGIVAGFVPVATVAMDAEEDEKKSLVGVVQPVIVKDEIKDEVHIKPEHVKLEPKLESPCDEAPTTPSTQHTVITNTRRLSTTSPIKDLKPPPPPLLSSLPTPTTTILTTTVDLDDVQLQHRRRISGDHHRKSTTAAEEIVKEEAEDNKTVDLLTQVTECVVAAAAAVVAVVPIKTEIKDEPHEDKGDMGDEEGEDDDDEEMLSPRRPPPVSTRRTSRHTSDDREKETATSVAEDNKKLSREERKLQAIMKAIERMERQEQRKQEHQAKQAHRRESDPTSAGGVTNNNTTNLANSNSCLNTTTAVATPIQSNTASHNVTFSKEEAGSVTTAPVVSRMKRRRRKGRARTVSTNTRRNRLDSVDSVHSSDDTLQSPPPPPPTTDSITSIPTPVTPNKTAAAAGLLLALANGEHTLSKSPDRFINHQHPALLDSNSNSSPETPTPLSSACMLVAAAVAAVEPLDVSNPSSSSSVGGFKFPKTKKGLMNEWLTKTDSVTSVTSPPIVQPPTSLSLSFGNSGKNLAALAQAASFCSGNSSSGGSTPSGATTPSGSGSAKKRWLRQAISEDQCDSPPPVGGGGVSGDPVAPPKKRRLPQQVDMLTQDDDSPPPPLPSHTLPPPPPPLPPTVLPITTTTTDQLELTLHELHTGTSLLDYSTLTTPQTPIVPLVSDQLQQPLLVATSTMASVVVASELATPPLPPPVVEASRALLLDPRLAPRLNSEQLVGTVEKTLSFLGFEDAASITATTPPASTTTMTRRPELLTPAKRKLSITEYRQRKKLNNNDRNDEILIAEESNSSQSPKCLRNRSNSSSSATSGVSTDLDELTTVPTTTEPKAGSLTAFNSEPTELEKQRELGSLRLKKAFGLAFDDENRKTTPLNVETILKGDLPEPIKSSLSLASPTFPIPGSAELTPSTGTTAGLNFLPHHHHHHNNILPPTQSHPLLLHLQHHHQLDLPPSTNNSLLTTTLVPSTTFADNNNEIDDDDNNELELRQDEEDDSTSTEKEVEKEEKITSARYALTKSRSERFLSVDEDETDDESTGKVDTVVQPATEETPMETEDTPLLESTTKEESSAPASSVLFYTPDDEEFLEEDLSHRSTTTTTSDSVDGITTSASVATGVSSDSTNTTTGELEDSEVDKTAVSDKTTLSSSASYVPPFNNPLYPNTSYTSLYGSDRIDDEGPYAGRNPSPPPNMDVDGDTTN